MSKGTVPLSESEWGVSAWAFFLEQAMDLDFGMGIAHGVTSAVSWSAQPFLYLATCLIQAHCGKDACGCAQDLLVPKGFSNPLPTKYSLYNVREFLYLKVHYESLGV